MQYFLGADVKTLLLTLGYKSANARDNCIYCTCRKGEFLCYRLAILIRFIVRDLLFRIWQSVSPQVWTYKKQRNRLYSLAKKLQTFCFISENWHKCATKCTSPRFSVDRAGRLLHLPSLTPKDPGYKAPPLVNSEFFEFVVPDLLHTHFRLTDVLFSRTLDFFTTEAKASALKLCKDLGITVRLGNNGESTLSNLTLRMRKILLSEIFTESRIP